MKHVNFTTLCIAHKLTLLPLVFQVTITE